MGLFDVLRLRPIRNLAALGVFIDEQSSLLSQKIVQDYLRLRAGVEAQALFAETGFRAALEKARWEAYPLTLAMVGELVEAQLRPRAGEKIEEIVTGLARLVCELFDRKSVPAPLGEAAWSAARHEISHSITELPLHQSKTTENICDAYAGSFLALMPIHAKLNDDDFPALRADLKAALDDIHDKIGKRADLRALASQLADA